MHTVQCAGNSDKAWQSACRSVDVEHWSGCHLDDLNEQSSRREDSDNCCLADIGLVHTANIVLLEQNWAKHHSTCQCEHSYSQRQTTANTDASLALALSTLQLAINSDKQTELSVQQQPDVTITENLLTCKNKLTYFTTFCNFRHQQNAHADFQWKPKVQQVQQISKKERCRKE